MLTIKRLRALPSNCRWVFERELLLLPLSKLHLIESNEILASGGSRPLILVLWLTSISWLSNKTCSSSNLWMHSHSLEQNQVSGIGISASNVHCCMHCIQINFMMHERSGVISSIWLVILGCMREWLKVSLIVRSTHCTCTAISFSFKTKSISLIRIAQHLKWLKIGPRHGWWPNANKLACLKIIMLAHSLTSTYFHNNSPNSCHILYIPLLHDSKQPSKGCCHFLFKWNKPKFKDGK